MCPRFRLAIVGACCALDSQPKSLETWVGVNGGRRGDDTPTRAAIELSSPIACADRSESGELSSWQPFLPPPGGGGSRRVFFFKKKKKKKKKTCLPLQGEADVKSAGGGDAVGDAALGGLHDGGTQLGG